MVKVFVYGTLKRGQRAHLMLRGQSFAGEAATEARYRLLDLGGYPGLARAENGDGRSIRGEVWQLSAACLAALDAYEGEEYERRTVTLRPAERWRHESVQAYVLRTPDWSRPDAGGEWTAA